MAGPRLFLVDDDREYCADLEAVLGGKYTIFQAHSGDSALEMLDKVGPDVVLLDVDFGVDSMSGLEILERVRARSLHRQTGGPSRTGQPARPGPGLQPARAADPGPA